MSKNKESSGRKKLKTKMGSKNGDREENDSELREQRNEDAEKGITEDSSSVTTEKTKKDTSEEDNAEKSEDGREKEEHSQNSEVLRNYRDFFDSVHCGKLVPDLPNRSWSMHCVSEPEKCIVFTEIAVYRDTETGLIPVYKKQIILDDKMNYDLFLLNSRMANGNKPAAIMSLEDLTRAIKDTDSLKLCPGGPELSIYGNFILECAYKDPNGRWRHNLCSLEVSDEDPCEPCESLTEILRKLAHRTKQAPKKNFIGSSKRKRSQA